VNTVSGPDWTVQVTDTIESVVGSIRDKTTVPAETIARALVYGIVIAVVGTAAIVLMTVGLVRLLDNWLKIWGVYGILGGLFTLLGLFLWRKRRPTGAR
jgi:ABC-type amino acid transport system permease subunit